jgi:hypothetical protein
VGRATRERERQTRRTAYALTRLTAVPKRDTSYKRLWIDASPAEQQAEIEYRAQHSGRDTAVHEAGHAVAAWLQGEKISHVMFNDRGSAHHNAQLDRCVAMTVTGETLTDDEVKNNKSALQGTAEGFVQGCKAAFITLAGALAQGLYLEGDSPITMRAHGAEAAAKLRFFSGLSEEAVVVEHIRILGIVSRTFEHERIRNVTLSLAAVLYEKRYLSGESVMKVIQAAWGMAKAASAGK